MSCRYERVYIWYVYVHTHRIYIHLPKVKRCHSSSRSLFIQKINAWSLIAGLGMHFGHRPQEEFQKWSLWVTEIDRRWDLRSICTCCFVYLLVEFTWGLGKTFVIEQYLPILSTICFWSCGFGVQTSDFPRILWLWILGQQCRVELTPTPGWPSNLSNGLATQWGISNPFRVLASLEFPQEAFGWRKRWKSQLMMNLCVFGIVAIVPSISRHVFFVFFFHSMMVGLKFRL